MGENHSLEKEYRRQGLGIKFKFTAKNTPQHNSQVERSFATLFGKIQAMMRAVDFN